MVISSFWPRTGGSSCNVSPSPNRAHDKSTERDLHDEAQSRPEALDEARAHITGSEEKLSAIEHFHSCTAAAAANEESAPDYEAENAGQGNGRSGRVREVAELEGESRAREEQKGTTYSMKGGLDLEPSAVW